MYASQKFQLNKSVNSKTYFLEIFSEICWNRFMKTEIATLEHITDTE